MSDQNMHASGGANLDGHSSMPSLNDEGLGNAKRFLGLLGVTAILLVGAGVTYWIWHKSHQPSANSGQKSMQMTSSVPKRTFEAPKPPPAPPAPPAPPPAPPPAAKPDVPGTVAQAIMHPLVIDKSGSDLMAGSSATAGGVAGGTQGPGGTPGTATPASAQAVDQGGMSAQLSGTKAAPHKASVLKNRNYLLTRGSFINCVLQTKLDTTVPGMTSCVVTHDVFSNTGKVVLIERGSTITGEYQSNMAQGMKRIFVLWDRVQTPSGVVVDLGSPGADPLGGSGLPGYVNNHFWQRFGGAIVISVIDDAVSGLAYAAQNNSNGNSITFSNTSGASQQMAAEALRNTVNIPPTLYKNQGEEIGIFVARDLDFSSVYDLQSE